MAQLDNDQRYPIFGDPPFYNVPFSRMHERTKTRGVTLVYFSVWTFFEQSCINISLVSLVWREIYSFHPSNIVFIVANTLKYAINKLLIFTSFTRYKYKFVFNLFYLISLLLSNCLQIQIIRISTKRRNKTEDRRHVSESSRCRNASYLLVTEFSFPLKS